MRDPITIDDVLKSRLIAWPFHLLDCCLVTDAGGAVIVTSAERARDLPKQPVYVLGTGECVTHQMVSQMPAFDRWDAAEVSGAARLSDVGRAAQRHRRRASSTTPSRSCRCWRSKPSASASPAKAAPSSRPAHRARRRVSDEHQRRRPVVHAHRHVRHLHAHRSGAPAARRMRTAPGARTPRSRSATAPAASGAPPRR